MHLLASGRLRMPAAQADRQERAGASVEEGPPPVPTTPRYDGPNHGPAGPHWTCWCGREGRRDVAEATSSFISLLCFFCDKVAVDAPWRKRIHRRGGRALRPAAASRPPPLFLSDRLCYSKKVPGLEAPFSWGVPGATASTEGVNVAAVERLTRSEEPPPASPPHSAA